MDVSEWSIDDIKLRMGRGNEDEDRLDFVHASDNIIKEFFVTKSMIKTYYNNDPTNVLYPPRNHRRTAKQIRDFYKLPKKGQIEKIETFGDGANIDIVTSTTQDVEDEDDNKKMSGPKPCCGFTLAHIQGMRVNDERRDKLSAGFKQLIRNGYKMRATLSKPDNEGKDKWSEKFAPPTVGALTSGNNTNDIKWRIEERQRNIGDNQFEYHSIHDLACKGDTVQKQDLCEKCLDKKRALVDQIESAYSIKTKTLDPNTNNNALKRHTSLEHQKIDHLKHDKQQLRRKIGSQEKIIESLTEKTGVDMKVTEEGDKLFSVSHEKAVMEFLDKKGVDEKSIVRYAFQQACLKQKAARDGKLNGVRHCPLMIRLGIVVRRKLGYAGGLYDLLANVCGLPSDRTLRRYKVANSNDPDGFMHSNLKRARDDFNKDHPNASKNDFRRHVTVAFDAMITKGRFGVNYHTNSLVGVSEDAFDESIIEEEWKALEQAHDNAEQNDDVALPELARNFLVFIATTWSPQKKQQILVARYGMKSITSIFLKNTILQAAIVLGRYGFIMDTIVGDGASENRAAFKLLANISARDIFDDKVPATWLKGLPLDFKIGFKHPSPVYKDIIIVIGGEMPHWVKKFRNAFDSNARELTYDGQEMKLETLYEIWKASGDASVSHVASLRRYNKTHDHFKLDSYNKMRVFLAVQIPSQNTIQMIKDYCNKDNYAEDERDDVPDVEEFSSMIQIFDKVDRLVDIMNGTGYKNAKDKKVELINKPKHRHVEELFDILRLFEDWKADTEEYGSKKFTYEYITRYTYEDLVWMVFGVAAVAVLYLNSDGSIVMHQGRSGSDVCEHFFAMIRYINQNPTMMQCREAASKVSADNISSHLFTFKGKQNAAKAERPAEDYLRPIKPATKKRKKK